MIFFSVIACDELRDCKRWSTFLQAIIDVSASDSLMCSEERSFLDSMGRLMAHGKVLALHTADAALSHGLGLAYVCLHESAVSLEEDADTQK